jgi:hypothetical protein
MKKDSLVALEQVYNLLFVLLSHLLHTSLYPLIFSIAVGVATSNLSLCILFNNAHEDNVSITTTNVIYFIT